MFRNKRVDMRHGEHLRQSKSCALTFLSLWAVLDRQTKLYTYSAFFSFSSPLGVLEHSSFGIYHFEADHFLSMHCVPCVALRASGKWQETCCKWQETCCSVASRAFGKWQEKCCSVASRAFGKWQETCCSVASKASGKWQETCCSVHQERLACYSVPLAPTPPPPTPPGSPRKSHYPSRTSSNWRAILLTNGQNF